MKGDSDPVITNSIIYYNLAWSLTTGYNIYLESNQCDPDFLYCDIEGGRNDFKGPGSGVNYTGQYIENLDVPVLDFQPQDDFSEAYINFYLNRVLYIYCETTKNIYVT